MSIEPEYFYELASSNIEKIIIINTILKVDHEIIKFKRIYKYFGWNDDIENFLERDSSLYYKFSRWIWVYISPKNTQSKNLKTLKRSSYICYEKLVNLAFT